MVLPSGSTAIAGWTVVGDQITWLLSGSQSFGSTPFGSLFLDLTGTHDNSSYGGVAQTITTTPAQPYTVSVSIGVNQNDLGGNGSKSILATAGTSSKSFTFTPSGAGMQWSNFNFSFVATSSSTSLSIVGTSSGSGLRPSRLPDAHNCSSHARASNYILAARYTRLLVAGKPKFISGVVDKFAQRGHKSHYDPRRLPE